MLLNYLVKLLNTKQTFKNKLYFYTLVMNILKMNVSKLFYL